MQFNDFSLSVEEEKIVTFIFIRLKCNICSIGLNFKTTRNCALEFNYF